MLRSFLLEFPQDWDRLLGWTIRAYNNSFHSVLSNTLNLMLMLRDDNLNYEALAKPLSDHDSTVAERAKTSARCLDLVRQAVSQTQEARREKANASLKPTIDIGDIVFAREIFTGRRDTKILPRYKGPFRITDLKGNSEILKSLVTGRMSCVSLRNVKLVNLDAVSQTNVNQPFPDYHSREADFDDPEVEKSPNIQRIKNNDDLQKLGLDKSLPAPVVHNSDKRPTDESDLAAAASPLSVDPLEPKEAPASSSGNKGAYRASTRNRASTKGNVSKPTDTVASRTRSRMKVSMAYAAWINELIQDYESHQTWLSDE